MISTYNYIQLKTNPYSYWATESSLLSSCSLNIYNDIGWPWNSIKRLTLDDILLQVSLLPIISSIVKEYIYMSYEK